MDYIVAIHKIIDSIVSHPEAIEITELENENKKDRTFVIKCEKDDAGRLIGKRGVTADALREVLSIAGKTNSERIHIKFVSEPVEESEAK